jgi:hypothetical protein
MRWAWSLVVLTLASSHGICQEPSAAVPVSTSSLPCSSESPVVSEECFADDYTSGRTQGGLAGNHSFSNFVGFVSNPLQNIDPRSVTAIYPIFGAAWVNNAAPIPNGDFQGYGPALTVALSDRLAIGLNEGGYATAQFGHFDAATRAFIRPLLGRFEDKDYGGDRQGFVNLGGFVQYTVVEDVADQFLLTCGLRWEAPCGSHEIFQGYGPLHLAPYLTAGKEIGEFHVLATTGYNFPAGPGSDNSNFFYANLHLDRRVFCWLYPLVEFNSSYHVRSVEFGLPTRRGFIDLGNFDATGNILTVAVGANALLVKERVEIGAVYSTPLATQRNFDFNALTVKMVFRF